MWRDGLWVWEVSEEEEGREAGTGEGERVGGTILFNKHNYHFCLYWTYQHSSRLHNLLDQLSAAFLSALQCKSSLATTHLKPGRPNTCVDYGDARNAAPFTLYRKFFSIAVPLTVRSTSG